jgi:hypothetical protein
MPLLNYRTCDVTDACVQVMMRLAPDWKPAASREEAPKLQLGDLIEAVDVAEEQEDTVFWRGCVHELKPDGQVRWHCNSSSIVEHVPPELQMYGELCVDSIDIAIWV